MSFFPEIVDSFQAGGPWQPFDWHKVAPGQLEQLLMSCTLPAVERPSSRQFISGIQAAVGCPNNIVDHIIRRLEAHAVNLEEVVHERTQSLVEERRRADDLLQEMLPA